MSTKKIERKIAVIFATDVVGYSKHMETDESETVQNLRACEKILTKLFDEFDARLFNTGGDSFLAEFPSAVSAVECAVAFQEAIQERNKADDTTVKLEFRIGINSGDVIKEKDNLLGDGVNIAARLEALAQTNGITISKGVYDFVKGKTKFEFNDIGLQKVKQNEFHAYDILLVPSQKRSLKKNSTTRNFVIIAASLVVLLIGVTTYIFLLIPRIDSAVVELPSSTSNPKILVSPIRVLGKDSAQAAFSQGVTESMITTLSKYIGISVLSNSASLHAENTNMKPTQIRDDWGVDFIISGSTQLMGQNARINLELTDLNSQEVVWSKKKDFTKNDIFKVQDEVSEAILGELQINAVQGNSSNAMKWTEAFDSMEDYTQLLNFRLEWRKWTPESHFKGQKILDQLVMNMNKGQSLPYALQAWQLWQKILMGISNDPEADKKSLQKILDKGFEIQETEDMYAVRALVGTRTLGLPCESAKSDLDKAIGLGGGSDTLTIAAGVYSSCDDQKQAIGVSKRALALTPNDADWFITSNLISYLHLDNNEDEIRLIMKNKGDAKDWPSHILMYFSYLNAIDENLKSAKSYLDRALERGADIKRLKRTFRITDNDHEIIRELVKLGLKLE